MLIFNVIAIEIVVTIDEIFDVLFIFHINDWEWEIFV